MERPKAPKEETPKLVFISDSYDRYNFVQRPEHESVEILGPSGTSLCESPVTTKYRIPAVSSLELPGQGEELVGIQIPELKPFFESLRKNKEATSFDLIMRRDKIILEYENTTVVLTPEKISSVTKYIPQSESKSPDNHPNRPKSPIPVQNLSYATPVAPKIVSDIHLTSMEDIFSTVGLETLLIHIIPLWKRDMKELNSLVKQHPENSKFHEILTKVVNDPKSMVLKKMYMHSIDRNWQFYTQKGREGIAVYLDERKDGMEEHESASHGISNPLVKAMSPPPSADHKRPPTKHNAEASSSGPGAPKRHQTIASVNKQTEAIDSEPQKRLSQIHSSIENVVESSKKANGGPPSIPVAQSVQSPKKSAVPKKAASEKVTKPSTQPEKRPSDTSQLRQEFKSEYEHYCKLHERIQVVRSKFGALKRSLESASDQADKTKLAHEVQLSYKAHSESFKRDVEEYRQLHERLQEKKQRIESSDASLPNAR